MKKLIACGWFVLGLLLSVNLTASAQSFQKGDAVLNGGIGLGSTYTWSGGMSLPLGVGFEYGVADLEVGSVGVGGDFGYVSGSGLNILYIGGKGTYHFNELFEVENDKLDIYGGLGIYYRSFSYSGTNLTFGSGIIAGFHVGTRYYFADNIGGYAELGNNWAWLNIGVAFKL